MFPFAALSLETSAADLLEQVRWRDGLQCPRCRSESVIKYGSYRAFQRYLCKDCDRTFNDKTRTIFALVIRISFASNRERCPSEHLTRDLSRHRALSS